MLEGASELVDRRQEANRSWLEYLQSEADLSAEFTSKMIAARSIPGAATALLEWTSRHVELAAVDAKHVVADTRKIMEVGVRLLPGGWLFNGKGRGSSTSAATARFPSPASRRSSRLFSVADGTVLNLPAARQTKGSPGRTRSWSTMLHDAKPKASDGVLSEALRIASA